MPQSGLRKRLSKRSSFDAGIYVRQCNHHMDEAKDQVIKIQKPAPKGRNSPIIDVENLSDEEEKKVKEEPTEDQRVLSLAEQFIAAMPARIKEGEVPDGQRGPTPAVSPLPCDASDDLGIESMGDELEFELDLNFDDGCNYRDAYTPSSALSMSPSSSCLHSPTFGSPSPCTSFSVDTSTSPQGTTQDLQEFLQVSCF